MTFAVAVVIPCHNSQIPQLSAAIEALRRQSLAVSRWHLVLVNNASKVDIERSVDLSWHPTGEVVREESVGLTHARLRGFEKATADLIVLVDDDNVLAPDYLEQAVRIGSEFPFLGTWGGQITPRFERPELAPPQSLFSLLTLREVPCDLWSNDPNHHSSTPWGAGLCLRWEVAEEYARRLLADPQGFELDLQGQQLRYGGDTELAYVGCEMGKGKGVFGALRLEHLIPAKRCTSDYLAKVAEGRGYSEVLHQVVRTGSLPKDRGGVAAWVRQKRAVMTGSRLERTVARARFSGRARAMAELSRRLGEVS